MARRRKDDVTTTVSVNGGPEVEVDLEGHNSGEILNRLAGLASEKLDEIAELQEEVKAIRQSVKSNGFNVKTFNQVVKEMRRGPEYQADQLTLELELDTYRAAVELPRTLEEAQQRIADEAKNLPGEG